MQTAMKEHIQWLYDNQLELNIPIEAIQDAEDRLEMEKQQIITANRDGVDMAIDNKPFVTGEEYYNKIYVNKMVDDGLDETENRKYFYDNLKRVLKMPLKK